MNDSSRQTMTMIGIALLVVAGILVYVSLSQPRIADYSQSPDSSVSSAASSDYGGSSGGVNLSAAQNGSSNLTQSSSGSKSGNSGSDQAVTGSSSSSKSSQNDYSYPVNLNTATLDELMSIDGLGESRASAILEYRDYLGKYDSVEQIKDIKGFGDSLYEKVSPYLTV